MKAGRPSRTSEGTTAIRAAEMRRPEADRICHDPFARHFLSPYFRFLGRNPTLGRLARWLLEYRCPGLRGGVLARTRFMDERSADCLRDGARQLVILGAGYDSRAYRLVTPASNVTVFEVDHPATQAEKIIKLKELLGDPPAHVVFVPADFCHDDFRSSLVEAGYDRTLKTLFIWEGVIYYLTETAVDNVLAFVAHHSGSGSTLLFDYFPRSVIDGSDPRKEAKRMAARVRSLGEPFRFGLDDEEVEPFLRDRGFSDIQILHSESCREAWFHGVNGNMNVSDVFRFVKAATGPYTGGLK